MAASYSFTVKENSFFFFYPLLNTKLTFQNVFAIKMHNGVFINE